jgi:hypothetical protein
MNKSTAWQAIQTTFRCSAELQKLLQLLKQELSADEYRPLARGIATAIDTINVQVMEPALKAHPDLEHKIESDLAKFGRIDR